MAKKTNPIKDSHLEESSGISSDIDFSCGTIFTHVYPSASGKILHYTLRVGRIIDTETYKVISYVLIVMTTQNDPRKENFLPAEGDTTQMIPMTENALYGWMSTLTTLRQDMVPETSAMLSTVFDKGHFIRN